jgi:hypothetical protein
MFELGYRHPYPREFTLHKFHLKDGPKEEHFGEVHCAQIGLNEEHLMRVIA